MSKTWTSLPVYRGKCSIIRNLAQGIMIAFCGFSLSGCGPVSSLWDGNKNETSYETAPPPLLPQDGKTAGITPLSPPDAGIKPLLPGQSGTQYTAAGLPVLQPSHGVNLETLFAQDIRDPIARVKRVENAVIDIRKELDAITPSIVRLVAVEKDIQSLVEQLELLLRNEPPQSMDISQAAQKNGKQQVYPSPAAGKGQGTPPTAAAKTVTGAPTALTPEAVYTPPPEVPKAQAPIKTASGINVREVRFGEHKNKTRLVLDVSGPSAFRYDLDKMEKLLIIELPQTGWAATTEWISKKAPLVASYSAQPMNGGSRMIIQLKHETDVIYSGSYAPNKDSTDYRIVLDLAAPAVHGR